MSDKPVTITLPVNVLPGDVLLCNDPAGLSSGTAAPSALGGSPRNPRA
jgi:hypothetical protein